VSRNRDQTRIKTNNGDNPPLEHHVVYENTIWCWKRDIISNIWFNQSNLKTLHLHLITPG